MRRYVFAVLVMGGCTVLGLIALPLLTITDIAMLYLVAAGLVAWRTERGPSVFAAVLSIGLFNFFFIPPRFTFAVEEPHYVVTFAVMLAAALVIGSLTHRLRDFAASAEERERRTAALYTMSLELASTADPGGLSAAITRHLRAAFDAEVLILLRDSEERPAAPGWITPGFPMDDQEWGIARWAFEHWEPAGLGTSHFPSVRALYLPLIASGGRLGVLGVRPAGSTPLTGSSTLQVLSAFAAQVALALERTLQTGGAPRQ